jgi:hypothetical protein
VSPSTPEIRQNQATRAGSERAPNIPRQCILLIKTHLSINFTH